MRLTEKLQKLCDDQQLDSQRDLARLAKLPKSSVHRWLKGESRPKMEHALQLARALGVPLEYLIDDAMEEPPAKDEFTSDEVQVLELYRALKEDPSEAMTPREALRRLRRPSLARDTGAEPGRSYGETRKPEKPGKPVNGRGKD